MESKDVITLALGVGTILGSGLMSSFVTYRLNRQKDQSYFMRTKAETLYLAADEYGRALGAYTIGFYPVIKGDIDWNQLLDLQIASGSEKREHGGAETMTMLVEIYFPSVRAALSEVFVARGNFNKFTADLKKSYIGNSGRLNPAVWMPRIAKEAQEIDNAIKNLQKSIVAAARTHAGFVQA